jgi:hypothetical protein
MKELRLKILNDCLSSIRKMSRLLIPSGKYYFGRPTLAMQRRSPESLFHPVVLSLIEKGIVPLVCQSIRLCCCSFSFITVPAYQGTAVAHRPQSAQHRSRRCCG